MAKARTPAHAGFTLIELMIAVAVVGILAAIALGQYRDYTRRAKMSEVLLAASSCKLRVAESFLSLTSAPTSASAWGCSGDNVTQYVSALHTSTEGVVRLTVANLDPAVNGLHVFMVPMHADGTVAMDPATDLGNGVGQWLCGSDAQQVRSSLPGSCRGDTTAYAGGTFE